MDLTAELLVFLVFSALTLSSALFVVTTRNLMHAGLYLMVALFGVAGLFVLLAAPFLAGVQIVVYIGAIAILIILAVMLTPNVTNMRAILNQQWPVNLALALIFFLLLVSVVTPIMDEWDIDDQWNADFTEEDPVDVDIDASLVQLGEDLVDPEKYMLPFEVASVLLMAALIGAVLLVNPGSSEDDAAAESGED